MLDEITDQRLAISAAQGDRAAFERLVAAHYERIHAFAWRFMGGPPDSEDLAHDVCVALGAKIRSYRGEAKFRTWLYQVVLNAARDRMRRDKTRARASEAFAEIDALRRAADGDRAREADWLRAAIATLKPDLRETAALVLDEGLSHAQAAEILDLSEGTVSWRLSEVRRELKQLAEEEGSAV
ncbi:MAG: RNA polymerase sigma factor [Pseudomonadota bacterium]